MSEPLRTTQLFAFKAPEVKPGELVVAVLLQGAEWAAVSAPRNVWRQLHADLGAALEAPTINPKTNRPLRYQKKPRPAAATPATTPAS